jgi:hypothetical protein
MVLRKRWIAEFISRTLTAQNSLEYLPFSAFSHVGNEPQAIMRGQELESEYINDR